GGRRRLEHRLHRHGGGPRGLHHHALRAGSRQSPAPRPRHARAAPPARRQENLPRPGVAAYQVLVTLSITPWRSEVISVTGEDSSPAKTMSPDFAVSFQ